MLDRWKITAALVLLVQPCIASDSQSFQISVIPSFFRGPKCNWRSALRCGGSRLTSPEARVRGSELSRKRLRHAQCGTLGPPFALYEGQKASKRGRSRNEGIPEAPARPCPGSTLPWGSPSRPASSSPHASCPTWLTPFQVGAESNKSRNGGLKEGTHATGFLRSLQEIMPSLA